EQTGATQRNDATNATHVTTTGMTNDTSKAVAETAANAHVFASGQQADATRYSADRHVEATKYSSDKAAETRMSQEDKAILGVVMDDAKQALAQKQSVTTAMEKELQNAVTE